MILPNNGKVLIIDDNINEALPLMKMLSKVETPFMYFSGQVEEFPENPFTGIRIIFLDLRFTTSTNEKVVIGNLIHIFKKLIDLQNGPFILIVWSKHEEYMRTLLLELEKNDIHPEFIMRLTKSEYFETETNIAEQFAEYSIELINRAFGYDVKNEEIAGGLGLYLQGIGCFEKKIGKPDAINRIANKLKVELEKANLFSLFVLWENTTEVSHPSKPLFL